MNAGSKRPGKSEENVLLYMKNVLAEAIASFGMCQFIYEWIMVNSVGYYDERFDF